MDPAASVGFTLTSRPQPCLHSSNGTKRNEAREGIRSLKLSALLAFRVTRCTWEPIISYTLLSVHAAAPPQSPLFLFSAWFSFPFVRDCSWIWPTRRVGRRSTWPPKTGRPMPSTRYSGDRWTWTPQTQPGTPLFILRLWRARSVREQDKASREVVLVV